MPPGAIGGQQLQRGGPLSGFYQPVSINAPRGAAISLAEEGVFGPAEAAPVTVGMLIGQVYRVRVMNIPGNEGFEVFPTIEVIDRLYTPSGREWEFPIEVQLTREELKLALAGKFVTRVIYLEDPHQAIPYGQGSAGQHWLEVAPGQDPLIVADHFGKPVAILRMGARMPDRSKGVEMSFLFGCPPLVRGVAVEKSPSTSNNEPAEQKRSDRPVPAPEDPAYPR